jgi:hypothetical protein
MLSLRYFRRAAALDAVIVLGFLVALIAPAALATVDINAAGA